MKINEFKLVLEKKNCDFALFYGSDMVKPNPNMLYFSSYNGLGALVVPRNKPVFLVVPGMEFERAKKSTVKRVYLMEKKKFFESVHKIIAKNGIKKRNIAIDKNNFTLNSYKSLKASFKRMKAKDISLDCAKLREQKTGKEIRILQKSCSYSDKIVQKAINNFKDFRSESEAAAFLDYEAKAKGLEPAFKPIVASGSNASIPHYEPSSAKIKNGFCVIDFGVKYKGYCSDMTRTIYVGNPSKKDKEMYDFLLEIQENTISQIKFNKKCSELYDFVNASLGKYKNNFIHGLGHGIGVAVHELPNLTLNSKDRIRNNMVFTIEPGIYFPKRLGIRIEDSVLFKNKPVVLTKTTKDLLSV